MFATILFFLFGDRFRNKSNKSTCNLEAIPCFRRLSCSTTSAGVSTTLFLVNSAMVTA